MTLEHFAQRIAAMAFFREIKATRELGYGERNAYMQAFKVMDESYHVCFAADRPLVQTRFRP